MHVREREKEKIRIYIKAVSCEHELASEMRFDTWKLKEFLLTIALRSHRERELMLYSITFEEIH